MKILIGIFKFIFFVILSVLVLPSMAIMLWLHPLWEKLLEEVFSVGV